jgi:exopolyphosphatase/pppGpp-phosphohydrolase
MSKKVIAAIDVGSHAVRMKIGEINKSGKFNELENIRKIAVLGHDTFTKG